MLWNSFPDAVCDATSLTTLYRLLKDICIPSNLETINYDGYTISMDCYCKAPLWISCSIGRYMNLRLLLSLLLLLHVDKLKPCRGMIPLF